MNSSFDFKMFQPKGHLSNQVQAVWSASVSRQCSDGIKRWLQGDACSGIIFILSGEIYLNNTPLSSEVLLLPVSKQAQLVTLPPGSKLVGVRFHPAVSFSIFGTIHEQPTPLEVDNDSHFPMYSLFDKLGNVNGHYARIIKLYKWLHQNIGTSNKIPSSLCKALNALDNNSTLGAVSECLPLSQRQIERQFQMWLSMSPKYYQRIIRVKNTQSSLKNNPDAVLANLALHQGFTDQSHMTREFKQIAKITPKQYSKQITQDKNKRNFT